MALSLSLLTALPLTSDSDIHPLSRDADCTKRNVVLPPFGGIVATTPHCRSGPFSISTSTSISPITTITTSSESTCDAFTNNNGSPNHTLTFVARQSRWTGVPIRAIVPLPRRVKLGVGVGVGVNSVNNGAAAQGDPTPSPKSEHAPCFHDPQPRLTCSVPVGDGIAITDSQDDGEVIDTDVGSEGNDEDGDVAAPAPRRCYLYESITAARGLSGWSFEELRAECYAQALVATGTRPPPVVQPCLAIPPAFVPRSVLRNESWRSLDKR